MCAVYVNIGVGGGTYVVDASKQTNHDGILHQYISSQGILSSLEMFLVVTPGRRECCWHLVGGGQGQPPRQRMIQSNVNSSETDKTSLNGI